MFLHVVVVCVRGHTTFISVFVYALCLSQELIESEGVGLDELLFIINDSFLYLCIFCPTKIWNALRP